MYEHKPRLDGKVAIITGAGSSGPGVGNGKAAGSNAVGGTDRHSTNKE